MSKVVYFFCVCGWIAPGVGLGAKTPVHIDHPCLVAQVASKGVCFLPGTPQAFGRCLVIRYRYHAVTMQYYVFARCDGGPSLPLAPKWRAPNRQVVDRHKIGLQG